MMDIGVMQRKHRAWSIKNFGGWNRSGERSLLGVTEELGELCHLVLKRAQGIRKLEDVVYESEVRDAVGDIVMFLMDFCSREEIEIDQCIQQAWDEIKDRDWKKFPKNGRTE